MIPNYLDDIADMMDLVREQALQLVEQKKEIVRLHKEIAKLQGGV